MKILYKDTTSFQPCPEYNGIAKIVDNTELQTYKSEFGAKDQFRFILEINMKRDNGRYWTVATKPLTPSYHEKASLRKFMESVLGRPLTKQEIIDGYDTENIIGKYCNVIVEHKTTAEGKVFANLTYIGKANSTTTWNSDYERLADRDSFTKPIEPEEKDNTDDEPSAKVFDKLFDVKNKIKNH